MSVKDERKQYSFTSSLNEIEEVVQKEWPKHYLKVIDGNGMLAAICLSVEDEVETKIRTAFDPNGLSNPDFVVIDAGSKKVSPASPKAGTLSLLAKEGRREIKGVASFQLKDHTQFELELTAVVAEAELSRLPFTVILIRADRHCGFIEEDFADNLLANCFSAQFGANGLLYRYEPLFLDTSSAEEGIGIVALILVSMGLKRAREFAEKIREAASQGCGLENGMMSNVTVSIGLGSSSFGRKVSQSEFLAQIENSLEDARNQGNTVRWESGVYSENSCQVTAEERQQLFRW